MSEEQSLGDSTFFDVPASTSGKCLPRVVPPINSRSRDVALPSGGHSDAVDMVVAERAAEVQSAPPSDKPVTRSRAPQNRATNDRYLLGQL